MNCVLLLLLPFRCKMSQPSPLAALWHEVSLFSANFEFHSWAQCHFKGALILKKPQTDLAACRRELWLAWNTRQSQIIPLEDRRRDRKWISASVTLAGFILLRPERPWNQVDRGLSSCVDQSPCPSPWPPSRDVFRAKLSHNSHNPRKDWTTSLKPS